MRAEQAASKERALAQWQEGEDERLRQEAAAEARKAAALQKRQAARSEIASAYREVVEAEPEPEPEPVVAPAESHSEAVARMMRERREAREATERELTELRARADARRATAGVGGVFAAAPASTAGRIDRSLFQRPLISDDAQPPEARHAAAAQKSQAARSAWEWAMRRDEATAADEARGEGTDSANAT